LDRLDGRAGNPISARKHDNWTLFVSMLSSKCDNPVHLGDFSAIVVLLCQYDICFERVNRKYFARSNVSRNWLAMLTSGVAQSGRLQSSGLSTSSIFPMLGDVSSGRFFLESEGAFSGGT